MNDHDLRQIRRALISVSDKTGIVEFARFLANLNVEILSTGGTGKKLQEAQIPFIEVSSYTGFPEMMGGRLKTLHPKIHGGILGRRDQDAEAMASAGIPDIDLVVVNLYPFREAVARPDATLTDAIENIDIGGPAMLRAGAKNYASVTVVTEPADYRLIMTELESSKGSIAGTTRAQLAAKAFQHTAAYDGAIANYLGSEPESGQTTFGRYLNLSFERTRNLRYGENPHQKAALYRQSDTQTGLNVARQLQGKALSYNNISDTETAWQCVCSFTEPACVIVKHANPCGVGIADDPGSAYQLAYETDPVSAFGGIIAFNRTLDIEGLTRIAAQQFTEVIIAPAVSGDTAVALAKRKNTRLLVMPQMQAPPPCLEYRTITGGLLVQDTDVKLIQAQDLQTVTARTPTEAEQRDLLFAWKVAKFVKSNAMVVASGGRTLGIGAGQMSRVYSTKIAALKAADQNLETQGAVLASDAFLPFRDGLDAAAEIGISALIQPGGSVRDDEVIAAANEAGMAMVFTGTRHFRH